MTQNNTNANDSIEIGAQAWCGFFQHLKVERWEDLSEERKDTVRRKMARALAVAPNVGVACSIFWPWLWEAGTAFQKQKMQEAMRHVFDTVEKQTTKKESR